MPNQFIFGKGVNPGRLRREILDDLDIATQLTIINASSGVLIAVEINFIANLTSAEETVLSGIVSTHIPTPIKEFITHVNTINGLSGLVTLNMSENANVVGQQINDNIATLDITTGMPTASGELLLQNAQDIITVSGLPGTPGPSGTQGEQGPSGVVGPSGAQGTIGAQGPPGEGGGGGSGIFGSGLTHIENSGTFTTSSIGFQQALLLTTPSVEAGDYYISWSFESFVEDNDDFKETHRIRVDDSDIIGIHTIGHDDKMDWKQESGFAIRTLAAGVHTVDIDIRRGSDKTTGIRRRRLIIWRIA